MISGLMINKTMVYKHLQNFASSVYECFYNNKLYKGFKRADPKTTNIIRILMPAVIKNFATRVSEALA
jgi:hypothetical protein